MDFQAVCVLMAAFAPCQAADWPTTVRTPHRLYDNDRLLQFRFSNRRRVPFLTRGVAASGDNGAAWVQEGAPIPLTASAS